MAKEPSVWLDHIEFKQDINRWLNTPNQHFLVSHDEEDQGGDICSWIEREHSSKVIVPIYILPEAYSKFDVLRQVLRRFRTKPEIFPEFRKFEDEFDFGSSSENVNISMTGAHNVSAGTSLNMGNITQTAYVQSLEERRKNLLDLAIDKAFDVFFTDLQDLIAAKKIIILIRIHGDKGFRSTTAGFRNWFVKDFLGNLIDLSSNNLHLAIVCEGNTADLNRAIHPKNQVKAKEVLSFDDMVSATDGIIENNKSYCKGILDMAKVLNIQMEYGYFKTAIRNKYYN